jgi:hypothetical protein
MSMKPNQGRRRKMPSVYLDVSCLRTTWKLDLATVIAISNRALRICIFRWTVARTRNVNDKGLWMHQTWSLPQCPLLKIFCNEASLNNGVRTNILTILSWHTISCVKRRTRSKLCAIKSFQSLVLWPSFTPYELTSTTKRIWCLSSNVFYINGNLVTVQVT